MRYFSQGERGSSLSLLHSLIIVGLCTFCVSTLTFAESKQGASNASQTAKAVEPAEAPSAESQADDDELTATPASTVEEEEVILDPMEMRFRVNKIERGLGRDARVFTAPRIVTLTTLGAIGELSESVWRGKKLGVFHKVPIDLGNGLVSYNRVKVGEIKIKAVSQSILLGEVISDDLTRSFDRRKPRLKTGEARVVMVGDTARLERPIVAPKVKKKRRVYKPKKKSQYERKDMKWRL